MGARREARGERREARGGRREGGRAGEVFRCIHDVLALFEEHIEEGA
jgi:hypothetical protein